MYSNKNSLKSQLTANVGVLDTSISITSGEGVLRDTDTVACLEHYEDSVCTKREIVKITAKSTDTFTITRGFAVCIMNDSTKQQGQASQQFVVGDFLSVYLSKELRESLTTGITTNITNYETMVARVNAPRTCINNCCQDWKNAINTAYETRCCGNAGFGNGCDGDCVISEDTFLCADREYNFNNLTICEGVKVRFEGCGVPTINVRDKFCNMGTIDLRAGFVPACCQTDCRLSKGSTICNQCESWNIGCGGAGGCNPTCTASTYKGADGCNATTGCGGAGGKGGDATGYRAGTGGAGSPADGCNGGRGGNGAGGCSASSDTISGGGGGGGGGRCFGNGGDGGNGADSNIGFTTGGKGGNGGMWGKGGRGGLGGCQCNAYLRNGAGGGDGYYGGDGMYGRTGDSSQTAYGGAGGKGVICGGAGGDHVGSGGESTARYIIGGRGGDAITNVYGFHLNARNIRNCCVNGRGGDGGRGGNSGYCQTGGTGGNGANGGQMIISYDCIHEEGCFDIRGGNGGAGGTGRTQGASGTTGTDGRIVFNSVNYPYISDFNLENDSDNEAILISWKDPSIKQSSPTQWAKTIVRVSTTNYPATITDGTLVVEETVKNQYRDTPYSMSATDGTTYYFSAFAIDNNDTMIDVQSNTITAEFGLPAEYQEVEYIESVGGQFINTGYLPSSAPKIEIDFMPLGNTTSDNWYAIYGRRNTSNQNTYFCLYINRSSPYYMTPNYAGYDPGTNSGITAPINVKVNVVNDKGQFYVDGNYVSASSTTNTIVSANYTIFLFGNNENGGNQNRGTKMRLYSCKMWNDGELVRDFVPCYRISDGVIGLFDKVYEVFYTNSGSGSFTRGDEVVGRGGIQEVEYIESHSSGTGTSSSGQYINTGYKPNNKTKAEFKIGNWTNTGRSSNDLFSEDEGFSINGFGLIAGYYNFYSGTEFTHNFNDTNIHIGEFSQAGLVKDGTTLVVPPTRTFQSNTELCLFALNRSGSISEHASSRIYYFKIYDNGTLVRDFIPCYIKKSGKIGMRDDVNKKFYPNRGSGTFTKGADVN